MPPSLTYSDLQQAVTSSAAIVYRSEMQPVAGNGTKVYPSTYSEDGTLSVYLTEQRKMQDGSSVTCVVVDGVASQANRMEDAIRQSGIKIPSISVDLSMYNKGVISSLELPHRMADAYIIYANHNGDDFSKSKEYKELSSAMDRTATPVYRLDPASLLFGAWCSHDYSATARFQRVITAELVAIDAEIGGKGASRLDPIAEDTAKIVDAQTITESGIAVRNPDKDKDVGDLGFGHVLPTIANRDKQAHLGGVTCRYVLYTSTLSLARLRKLSFPDQNGDTTPERDTAARCVLAAMALVGVEELLSDCGMSLRSGCDLIADKIEQVIIGRNSRNPFVVDSAESLFDEAVNNANSHDLSFADSLLLSGDTRVLRTRFSAPTEKSSKKKNAKKKTSKKNPSKKKAAKNKKAKKKAAN